MTAHLRDQMERSTDKGQPLFSPQFRNWKALC